MTGNKIRHFKKSVTDRSTRRPYVHTNILLSLCKHWYLSNFSQLIINVILFLRKVYVILFYFEEIGALISNK